MHNRFFFIANCLILVAVVFANLPPYNVDSIQAGNPANAMDVKNNFEHLKKRLDAIEENSVVQLDGILYRDPDNANKVVLEGVNFHIENGTGNTETKNDFGNLIVGYNEEPKATCSIKPAENKTSNDCSIAGGVWGAQVFGSHNIIVGKGHSYMSAGGLIVGQDNVTDYLYTVALGNHNFAVGKYAVVSGGYSNDAVGESSSVSGGYSNEATGFHSSVSGGRKNNATNNFSSISGGYSNEAAGTFSSISGGHFNEAAGTFSSISGGYSNEAVGKSSSVSGGGNNNAYGNGSSISGGGNNRTGGFDMNDEYMPETGYRASVSGGSNNDASGDYSSISGGENNRTGEFDMNDEYVPDTGDTASVSGGYSNNAAGTYSSVSGGGENTASGKYSSISGGYDVDKSLENMMGMPTEVNGIYDWGAGNLYEDE